MEALILGDGNLGRAVAAALVARGDPMPRIVGRPTAGRHVIDAAAVARGGSSPVAIDASRGDAVAANVAAVLEAGYRRLVVATTGWDDDRDEVARGLLDHDAAAVVAPNFSLGVVLFGRLVEAATRLFGSFEDVDPYIVEWHRRTKPDRPSGTAKELARRLIAAHPRKRRLASAGAPGMPAPDELEVAVVRAGASPGMHLVGFDAPGETLELRLTARDRSAYAAGILAAADWLAAARRAPGIHRFEAVVDDLTVGSASPAA